MRVLRPFHPPLGLFPSLLLCRLVDGVKEQLEASIDPVFEDKEVGTAEVLELFTLTLTRKERKEGMGKFTTVAGSRVVSGEASRNTKVRVCVVVYGTAHAHASRSVYTEWPPSVSKAPLASLHTRWDATPIAL